MTISSKNARVATTFLRPSFISTPAWGIPVIERQDFPLPENLDLIAFCDTSSKAASKDFYKGVHFFIDDYRFERVYKSPDRYLNRLRQYAFVLTPDFSIFADMPRWRQLESLAKNRWCGAYWQSHGIKVIPTISWGLPDSYDFCFDGVEPGGVVAVSTLGCHRTKRLFLQGYEKMIETLAPRHIICFSKPFPEMQGNIHYVSYKNYRSKI